MATAAEKQAAVDLLVEEGVIEKAEDGEILTEAQVDKAMAVDNWINDLGGFDDAAIVVYQVDPSSNKMEYIESMGVQEMTGPMLFEKLKNVYGGGKFKIQMRADGAIRKTQTVLIKKVPIKETELPGPGGIDLPALVRELKTEQKDNSTEMILNLIQSQNTQFQNMITTLVGAMGKNDAPAFDPVTMQTNMLEGIAKMQQLAGLDKPEKSPTDLILEGVKLVSAIRGDGEGGGEANMYSVLSKAIGEFGGTIGQAMTMQQMPPPLTPPQGVPSALTPVSAQLVDSSAPRGANAVSAQLAAPNKEPATGKPTGEPLDGPTLPHDHPLAPFEPFVDWMLGLAEKNANPELYAEVIIDQIGIDVAQAWLATDEGINTLKENLPKVVPYENWLRLVGQEIKLIVEDNAMLEGESQMPKGSYPDVDDPPSSADNAGEQLEKPIAQDGDVRTGHDSPGPASALTPGSLDPSSVDGDTERPGGDSDHVTVDGEFSESSENDVVNT